jgi:multimeric flavodoxin WrbA
MRILALVGSPRKGGNSDTLADAILAAASAAGAEVEKIYLNDLQVRGCQACDSCRGAPEDECVLEDDMAKVVHPRLRACDGFVTATPIYYFGAAAQTKLFLDRWYALGGQPGEPHALRGKRAAIALAYEDADPFASGAANAMATFRDAIRWVGVELVGVVCGTAAAPGEIAGNPAVMQQARDLGAGLATP